MQLFFTARCVDRITNGYPAHQSQDRCGIFEKKFLNDRAKWKLILL